MASRSGFQAQVATWVETCFGTEVAQDIKERNHRFLEESLELVQSLGCTEDEAIQLVRYVYSRPTGEPVQEVGGVMLTLAALCNAARVSMEEAGNKELARVWNKIEQIRKKRAAKREGLPLP